LFHPFEPAVHTAADCLQLVKPKNLINPRTLRDFPHKFFDFCSEAVLGFTPAETSEASSEKGSPKSRSGS
jgi:hypothetical protein